MGTPGNAQPHGRVKSSLLQSCIPPNPPWEAIELGRGWCRATPAQLAPMGLSGCCRILAPPSKPLLQSSPGAARKPDVRSAGGGRGSPGIVPRTPYAWWGRGTRVTLRPLSPQAGGAALGAAGPLQPGQGGAGPRGAQPSPVLREEPGMGFLARSSQERQGLTYGEPWLPPQPVPGQGSVERGQPRPPDIHRWGDTSSPWGASTRGWGRGFAVPQGVVVS